MSDDNPYAAPAVADASAHADEAGRRAFVELDTKELKRLRDASLNIRVLGGLWILGTTVYLVLGATTTTRASDVPLAGVLAVGAVMAVAAVGALFRPVWGRPVGMVMCGVSLLGSPIGTLIGILGMIAFSRGVKLFGPNRWRHGAIIAEWKQRKRNKVA